ncbi:MAG: serine/threonine-protein kinase, partial [Pirellulales bacterium]|nr:serine/threonine-protein kinase [Pirellulales bacterium]
MDIEREIDLICDEFEADWGNEDAALIEDQLPRVALENRPDLLTELLKIDLDKHDDTEHESQAESYRNRFPQYAEAVERAVREIGSRAISRPPQDARAKEERLKAGDQIGKYIVLEFLGRGGFGAVYRAQDPDVGREIAIKVPLKGHLRSESEIEQFLLDAQRAASIRHPGIVTIHAAERSNGRPYIVQEFLPGGDLKSVLARKQFSFAEAARFILQLSEIVEAAHTQDVLHRDLKPGNILLREDDRPCIADFGLAMQIQSRHLHRREICGAPPYMAPEQVRGESNHVDTWTDVWSLGVILYQMLTGSLPFVSRDRDVLFDMIKENEPTAPRNLVPEIPAELERICLRCLTKHIPDRYPNARSLAADLDGWLNFGNRERRPSDIEEPIAVHPKGLRPFGENDSESFLQLLPGPRGADGVPDSIRFWIETIGELRPEQTFPVGLLYGPSGSGKTSFVKAGVFPRLPDFVTPIYVEATAEETELRVLRQIRAVLPNLPGGLDLPTTLACIRDEEWLSSNHKLLLVIDQFEQWLHANPSLDESQFLNGLRHCDGARVQAIVLVRDDFWMGATRFMKSLDCEIERGRNADVVDRFDLRHARKVLQRFGDAYEHSLPEDPADREDHEKFLEEAVQLLAEDDRVICVHLALWADMLKHKPWRMATLEASGSKEDVGVTFLEETFNSSNANPTHRAHGPAARRVLELLLPAEGAEIKGHMRSITELRSASKYAEGSQLFDELLNILDRQLRLITPTDPAEGALIDIEPSESEPSSSQKLVTTADRHYQLTHDFLVPALRKWIFRKEQQTRRGRAWLRLRERTDLWSSRKERKQLPSLAEWISIVTLTRAADRTKEQRNMLRAARWQLAKSWGLGFVIGIFIVVVAFQLRHYARVEFAESLVVELMDSPPEELEPVIVRMEPYKDVAVPILQDGDRRTSLAPEIAPLPRAQINVAIATAQLGKPDVPALLQDIPTAPLSQMRNFADALDGYAQDVVNVWNQVEQGNNHELKLRLIHLLLQMHRVDGLRYIMASHPDPRLRTEYVLGAPNWNLDLEAVHAVFLREATAKDSDAGVLTGLCEIVTGIAPEDFSSQARADIKAALTDLFKNSPSATVHSAAQFALFRWEVAVPTVKRLSAPRTGFEWFVNQQDITMLQVPSEDEHGQRLYMAATETTTLQFQAFAQVEQLPSAVLKASYTKYRPDPTRSPLLECP